MRRDRTASEKNLHRMSACRPTVFREALRTQKTNSVSLGQSGNVPEHIGGSCSTAFEHVFRTLLEVRDELSLQFEKRWHFFCSKKKPRQEHSGAVSLAKKYPLPTPCRGLYWQNLAGGLDEVNSRQRRRRRWRRLRHGDQVLCLHRCDRRIRRHRADLQVKIRSSVGERHRGIARQAVC